MGEEAVVTVRRGGESSTSEVLPSQGRFAVLGDHVTKPPETRRSPLTGSLTFYLSIVYS